MRVVGLVAATVLAMIGLAPPASAAPPLGDGGCSTATFDYPTPSAPPDTYLIEMDGNWTKGTNIVLTCSFSVSGGDRLELTASGDNVVVIEPFVTTITIPDGAGVEICTHVRWYDETGYHDDGPDCIWVAWGT